MDSVVAVNGRRYEVCPQHRAYRIPVAAEMLQLSRASVYTMIRSGAIRAVKFGRDWRIPAIEIERLLNGRPNPVETDEAS